MQNPPPGCGEHIGSRHSRAFPVCGEFSGHVRGHFMGFETALVARQVGDFDWELVEPLEYRGNVDLFEVPVGSKTDFASVPRMFQWLIPRSGRYTKASVLHDHLWRLAPEEVSFADADGIFRRAMAELKVPFLRRWLMWTAVRGRSLIKSRFRDGRRDIPRVVLLILFPGSLVIGGGVVVLVLLVVFWVVELVSCGILWLVRRIPGARVKPMNWPRVFWSS